MFCLHPSYITVSFFKQILSPISTSLLSYALSSSSPWFIFGMYYFLSPCLILHFLTIDCSVFLVKDTSSSGWHFIIIHYDDLSQTEGRKATAPSRAIKVKVQKNLHWFAPDLKGESANIEIFISDAWLQNTDWKDRALTKQNKGQQTSWQASFTAKYPHFHRETVASVIHRHSLQYWFHKIQKKKRKLKL